MRALVTGAAGFIGSSLVDRLLADGHEVIGLDNFSTGFRRFLEGAQANPRFRLVEADLMNPEAVTRAMQGVETVFHLAANADVRYGFDHPLRDIEQNIIATSNVLEAMRASGTLRIAFSSTGSAYGEPEEHPTPEELPFPVQTSLYATSKVAAEGLLTTYAAAYNMQVYIFRFVSILGERYTHGHVFDFYRQLREHPERLEVLGDGLQRKSYLYVQDCLDAILLATERCTETVNIFNLGTDEYCRVNQSIGWISGALGLKPELRYGGGERGWPGDSPFIFLKCERIRSLGWKPQLTIQQGILRTLEFLRDNPWVLESRA
ncbi:MAG: NAD-dependent epimerase/dehydratase family protein [Candidatus Solibacter sp.]